MKSVDPKALLERANEVASRERTRIETEMRSRAERYAALTKKIAAGDTSLGALTSAAAIARALQPSSVRRPPPVFAEFDFELGPWPVISADPHEWPADVAYHFPPYENGIPQSPKNPSTTVYESADSQAGVLGLIATVYRAAPSAIPIDTQSWLVTAEASLQDHVKVPDMTPAPTRFRVVTSFSRKGLIAPFEAVAGDYGEVSIVCSLILAAASGTKSNSTPTVDLQLIQAGDGSTDFNRGDVNLSCDLVNPTGGEEVTVTLSAKLMVNVNNNASPKPGSPDLLPGMILRVDSSGPNGIAVPGYLAMTYTS